MKLKFDKQKTLQIWIILLTIFIWYNYIVNAYTLENTQKELIEAKKPSKVEIQQKELFELESNWRATENQLNLKRELILETSKEIESLELQKPEIEEKIRQKRNEMLGLEK